MTAADVRPAIPASCEHRPTVGGMVIPWVNVQLADGGVDFRAQHDTRTQESFRDRLCQVCATPLRRPIVFMGGPDQLDRLTFDEPPLHPECANYVSHACPMVGGRQDRYADRTLVTEGHRGATCFEPGCDCGGYVQTPGSTAGEGGRPAHDWYAVFCDGYSLGVSRDQPDRVAAAVVQPEQVLVVRHVSTPGVGRTWTRVPAEWPA